MHSTTLKFHSQPSCFSITLISKAVSLVEESAVSHQPLNSTTQPINIENINPILGTTRGSSASKPFDIKELANEPSPNSDAKDFIKQSEVVGPSKLIRTKYGFIAQEAAAKAALFVRSAISSSTPLHTDLPRSIRATPSKPGSRDVL